MTEHEDLTLEKLKINERLYTLEAQMGRVLSHLESEGGTWRRNQDAINKTFDRLTAMLDRHNMILLGDLNPGLITKVDRLAVAEEGHKWSIRVLIASIFGLLAKFAFDLLRKP